MRFISAKYVQSSNCSKKQLNYHTHSTFLDSFQRKANNPKKITAKNQYSITTIH